MDEPTDAGGGSERETLRSFLRQWNVPGPPPEIEEDLRRAFGLRRRATTGRRVAWLSLAAGVTLLVAGLLRSPGPPLPAPAPTASPLPGPPLLPPLASVVTERAGLAPPSSVPVARPRLPAPPPSRAEVVIESEQAALLRQYAGVLRRLRQAEPRPFASRIEAPPPDVAPPTPAFEAADARQFGEWEAGGEWPSVHETSPTLGR